MCLDLRHPVRFRDVLDSLLLGEEQVLLSRSRRRCLNYHSTFTVWGLGSFCFHDTASGRDTRKHGQWSASGHCRLATRLLLKHSRCLMRLALPRFRTWALYLGDDIRVSRQRFYGNDINDFHLFICPVPFSIRPWYFGSLGRLKIEQSAHKIPSHMYFYIFFFFFFFFYPPLLYLR